MFSLLRSPTSLVPAASTLLRLLRRRSLLRELFSAILCAVLLLPPGYAPVYGTEEPPAQPPEEEEFEPFENLELVCEEKQAKGSWSRMTLPGEPPTVGESGMVVFSDGTSPLYDLTSPAEVESERDDAFANVAWTERGYDATTQWSNVPTALRPKDEMPPETDPHRVRNWLDENTQVATNLQSFEINDHSASGSQLDAWQRSRHAVRFHLRRQFEISGAAKPVREVKALLLHYRIIVSWTDTDGDDSSRPRELGRSLVAAKVYALQGEAAEAETYTYDPPAGLPPNCSVYDKVFLHGLCEFDVQPGEEAIVPTDVGSIDLPTSFWSETEEHDEGLARVVEVKVRWQVKEGGGSLSRETDTLTPDEPDSDTTLTFDSHDSGHVSRVEAEIEQITLGVPGRETSYETVALSSKVETAELVVAPGEVDEIGMGVTASSGHGGGASMPADGVSEREITAVIEDAFGNPVAEGVHVSWRLKGDGTFVSEETLTDVNGKARVRLRAGRVPGLAQVVICEADLKRVEFAVENTALGVNLTPGPVAVLNYGTSQVRTFTVTAQAAAADGTPVRFQTTQGVVSPEVTALSGGQATATVRVDYGSSSAPVLSGPLTVVRAAVAESAAIASAQMTTSMALASGALVAGGSPVTITITAPPAIDGQSISVQARALLTQQTVQDAAAVAAGTPPGVDYTFADMDYQARVTWTRPPEGQPFSGLDLLTGASGSRLAVDANGRPYVVIRVSNGRGGYTDTRYDLPASTTQTAPGATSTVEFSCQAGGLLLGLAWQGERQTFARSSVVSGKLDVVPVASRLWVTEVTYARLAYSTQVPGGTPPSGVVFTGLDAGGFTTTSGGTASFTVSVPADFPYPVLEIRTLGSGSPVVHIPVSAAAPPPGTPPPPPPAGQLSAALSAQFQGIVLDVEYANRMATAQEQAEIARDATKKAACGTPEKAIPPAFGGGLAHQSSASLNFLVMAKQLNDIVADIQEQAERMNTVAVTDATGAQLYQINVGLGVCEQMRYFGLSNGLQRARDYFQPFTDALKQAHSDGLTALVRSMQSTASWTHMQITSRQLGGYPLMGSVDKIATQLTDEGLVDYAKALARYAYQFQQTPDAAALVTFEHLDNILKVPLNQWAQNGGDFERTIVESAGIIMFGVQAGLIAGSASVDQGAARRMVGQLTGTILSASYGSEDARNSLKEMIPFWSWSTLTDEAIQLEVEAGDYYAAGKKIGELMAAVVGDVTILVPVVKGTAIALKASGNVLKATLTQALKKTGANTFKVEIKALADDASQLVRRCAEGIRCFPAGTRVLLADGNTRPIEQIREGDLVMADDPTDAQPATARCVTQVLAHWTQSLVAVETDADHDGQPDGSFQATPNHPVWAVTRGWVLAGDLQPGDELRDAQGAAVAVLSTRTFNQTCATYNLGVAQDHSFLVLSGATPVLVHNINPGPRAWVIYRATKVINGVEHAYIGKASMPSDSKNFKPDDVFRSRYRETKGILARSNITASADQVEFLHMFWEEGLPSGMTGSKGRMKSYGEVIAQALEAYEEFKFRETGRSLNIDRPLSPRNPHFDDILDMGESFLQNRNGGIPCAGIHRPH